MATEIERKFLVRNNDWQSQVYATQSMRQGYLVSDEKRSVRIRIANGNAKLNIKSATLGVSRSEFEYSIPIEDANEILNTLCRQPLLEKVRHFVRYADHIWEIDVFEGDNTGLVIAEIELGDADEAFVEPDWVAEEVSGDPRYYNSELARKPYRYW